MKDRPLTGVEFLLILALLSVIAGVAVPWYRLELREKAVHDGI